MRELLLCLPVLGITLDVSVSESRSSDTTLFIRAKGVDAKGAEVVDGFVVFAGSEAVMHETVTVSDGVRKMRQSLFEQGVLKDTGEEKAEFMKDHLFGSPSTASSIILGSSSNGRDLWKNQPGETLNTIQLKKLKP